MKFAIIGCGCMGGYFGAMLTRAGMDCILLDRDPERARLLNAQGLRLCWPEGREEMIPLKVSLSAKEIGPRDVVIVAVKGYSTQEAAERIKPLVHEEVRVVSLQNGLGPQQVLARFFGDEKIICATTAYCVEKTGLGSLKLMMAEARVQLANFASPIDERLREVGHAFSRAGLKVSLRDRAMGMIWQKLLKNAACNPLCALTSLLPQELLERKETRKIMEMVLDEGIEVMRALGLELEDEKEPTRPALKSIKALGSMKPSMLQDMLKGKATEVDTINGAIVKEAKRLGLKAPCNELLTLMVKAKEQRIDLLQAVGI